MGPSTTKEFVYVTGREEGRSALPTMCEGRAPLRKKGMGEGGLRFHSRLVLYVWPLRVGLRITSKHTTLRDCTVALRDVSIVLITSLKLPSWVRGQEMKVR